MVQVVTNGVYRFCEWITRLAYLNLLWLSFSLVGLVVFGITPSTVAMFTVVRKWLAGDTDFPIYKTFFAAFKKEFVKANIVGLILFGIAALFYVDFMIFGLMNQEPTYVTVIFTSLLTVFGVLVLFLFPVYVYYDIPLSSTFKYALLISFSRPLHSLGMAAASIGLTFLILQHITIIIFFSGSLFAFIMTAFAMKAFKSIDTSKRDGQTIIS